MSLIHKRITCIITLSPTTSTKMYQGYYSSIVTKESFYSWNSND